MTVLSYICLLSFEDSSPLCNDEFKTFADKYINLSNILNGFIIVMTQTGQLVYVSENVQDFFGLNSVRYKI